MGAGKLPPYAGALRVGPSGQVRRRAIVALLGTECYGLCLRPAAEAMGKSQESTSRWVAEAATRRPTEPAIAARFEQLATALAWSTPRAGDRTGASRVTEPMPRRAFSVENKGR